ncbi:uncharacterized protein LOC131068006 isoform X2 [Cryptomeria japonica]|uniref:uncharacterized protein LOC131068006 isoform X2 n=1 Tax=Cryptomeria japonica TaxID=3369 RepID=UPI0027DA6547|nr:uncharacterized protein LOC131068006 isoform X2 [Cryptomeria japonica]
MKDGNSVDISPPATTIAFDPVIPLLRVPVQAGEIDDPSKGLYVLAFKDEDSWRCAWHACESRLLEQCEAGARMGCSVGASNKCKPPWWKYLFHIGKVSSDQIAEREACEEHEMKTCVLASRDACIKYAKDTCRPTFENARIAKPNQNIDSIFTTQNYKTVNCWNSKSGVKSDKRLDGKLEEPICSSESDLSSTKKREFETTYRGRTLLGEASSERHQEGLVRVEGSIQTNEVGTHGDGREGGLAQPKIVSTQSKPSNDVGKVTKPGLPFLNYLQQQIITKLNDIKFGRNGS